MIAFLAAVSLFLSGACVVLAGLSALELGITPPGERKATASMLACSLAAVVVFFAGFVVAAHHRHPDTQTVSVSREDHR